ncbi:class I SAM-dependent methyltransferase [Salinirubellus salinus]|uniref:Class I SAM-dependent methyltransferase n=1 Tax=Salinirubellus salinus TaxID=1364945 RepID=A0A9E7R5X6_9EURY|nr:class I SAM-dependent methyltransferase [Salinirubellus salinus]UWM56051.1 class I SAM-dependent methyltransferase [Salinirubellus salinus]
MSERDEILDNARYLRNVRPVDPEEIHEYVSTAPHPAVVRQTLREAAFDLGMREREDGTFAPVEDGPASVTFHGVESFPEAHARRLEDLLVETYGAGWADGESGGTLRERLRRTKEAYFGGRDVAYDRDTALAYALYHLPDYYAAVQYPLADLAADGLLPRRLRVLEVGAGVGGPALGVHDLLGEETLVEYHAVEPSDDAADVFERLLGDHRPGFRPIVHRETAEAFDPASVLPDGEGFDLVLFANVLSELVDPEPVARRYAESLAPDGSLLLLAPADRNTAIGMRQVERALADDGPLSVYAPTVRLWPNDRPTDRGWSFEVKPDLAVPGFQRELDRPAGGEGEFVNVDVQYAYATLRRDGRTAVDARPSHARHAKLADSEDNVTQRVDFLALKLSHDLSEGGNPLFKMSDGSESVDHYAVLTRRSALNDALVHADYGDPLAFENALVLWNDDEESYNVVVDGETIVDQVG